MVYLSAKNQLGWGQTVTARGECGREENMFFKYHVQEEVQKK